MHTDDPRSILDVRLAKGEITLEEHKKLEAALCARSSGKSFLAKLLEWKKVKWGIYFALLWLLGSINQLLSGGFPWGYWQKTPEMIAPCFVFIAFSGICYGAVSAYNREMARRRAWEILSVGAVAAFFLMRFGAAK